MHFCTHIHVIHTHAIHTHVTHTHLLTSTRSSDTPTLLTHVHIHTHHLHTHATYTHTRRLHIHTRHSHIHTHAIHTPTHTLPNATQTHTLDIRHTIPTLLAALKRLPSHHICSTEEPKMSTTRIRATVVM